VCAALIPLVIRKCRSLSSYTQSELDKGPSQTSSHTRPSSTLRSQYNPCSVAAHCPTWWDVYVCLQAAVVSGITLAQRIAALRGVSGRDGGMLCQVEYLSSLSALASNRAEHVRLWAREKDGQGQPHSVGSSAGGPIRATTAVNMSHPQHIHRSLSCSVLSC
jgi:hypothetical protein